ncbi:MAG: ATP-binding cassette domain-containing protein [Clostridia bacterium]|nr:ATP-binding cassette domain-containing protein [Clostridia bacterium]
MSNIVIKTENISKTYKNTKANDNVSVTVYKGAIYGLIGRNGAGKTTLMRVLLGLTKPDSGTMEIMGKTGKDLPLARKKIGFIIENPTFYDKMSAYDNMKIRARLIGLQNEDLEIENALKKVGLYEKRNLKVKGFSLGMRQSLGIASAILGSPELLILDEPVNGLDPIAIVNIREILVDLNKKGTTILISSHILGEMQKLATCYGFILDGKLVREISEKEVKDGNLDLEQLFMDLARGGM